MGFQCFDHTSRSSRGETLQQSVVLPSRPCDWFRTLAYLNGIWICSTPDRAYTSARSGPHVGQIGPASPDRRCLQITKLLRDLNLFNAWFVDSFYPCTGDLLHPGDWIRTTRELSTRYTLVCKTCFCPSDLNYFNPWSVAFTQAVRPAERSLERECREKCTEDVLCQCDLNHYNRLVDAFTQILEKCFTHVIWVGLTPDLSIHFTHALEFCFKHALLAKATPWFVLYSILTLETCFAHAV